MRKIKETFKQKTESARVDKDNNLAMKEMMHILDKANLNSGDEIFELESKQNYLANNFEINNSIKAVFNNLNNFSNEQSSVDFLIAQSIKHLNKIAEYDGKIEVFREQLLNIQNDLENLIFDLNNYIQHLESPDISLDIIQERLYFLKNLQRTFTLDLSQLIAKRDQLKKHFFSDTYDKEIQLLEEQISFLQQKLNHLFITQSFTRKQVANKLQISVISILKNLGLENANFSIEFEEVSPSVHGTDNIKFLFSANPDQKLAPLSKVISGEMSDFVSNKVLYF